MTQTKGTKAAASKGAAARAERNGKAKTAKFRGITLILPPELGVEVGYAYADLEGAQDRIKPFIDFVESLIGVEQMAQVKAAQVKAKLPMEGLADDLNKLLKAVFAAYGTDMGESSASPAS